MKQDKLAGVILILGAVSSVVTMMFHPTGGSAEGVIREAPVRIGIHALAIVSIYLQVVGFRRYGRTLGPDRPHGDAGLVAFAFAAVAVTIAAATSGFIAPDIAHRMVDADVEDQAFWKAVFTYNILVNRTFARLFVAATSVAVIIWSLGMLRISRRCMYLGGIGVTAGLAGLLVLVTGHLRMNVHGMAMFVFGLAIWTIVLGVFLLRADHAPKPD